MKLLNRVLVASITAFLFLFSAQNSSASLVSISDDGFVTVNVLSEQDSIELEIPQREYLEVKEAAEIEAQPDADAKISLLKEDGKIVLNVSTRSGDKSLDVTNYSDNLLEVEERPQIEKIAIGFADNKFNIKQRGVIAETDYEINVNPRNAGLTLVTSTGLKYLSILPRQAVDTLLRTKLINRLKTESKLVLQEEEGSDLVYTINGEKVFNLFDVYEHVIPVSAKVSASTGEIVSIEEPSLFRYLGFLFV